MYLLRKWYLDLLTREGTYLFVYFAYVRLAGAVTRSLVLHIAPEGSERTITFPLSVKWHREQAGGGREIEIGLEGGAISVDRKGCRITARNSHAEVDILFTPVVPGGTRPVLIKRPAGGRILWEPIGIRYRVDGHMMLNGSRVDLDDSSGYVDFLESTILPPWVPVRQLLWGRAHQAHADLAFMHASGVRGTPSWSRFILHREQKIEESDDVEIADRSGGYLLRARLAGEEFQMTVTHRKPVQIGSFIDQQDIRWPIARSLVKKITRDPRGSKFLSSIDVPGWGATSQGSFMIDEEAYL